LGKQVRDRDYMVSMLDLGFEVHSRAYHLWFWNEIVGILYGDRRSGVHTRGGVLKLLA